jgi:hypothetical protein
LKIGYVLRRNRELDSRRSKMFLDMNGFNIVDRFSFVSILRNRPTHYFIQDNISFIELFLIIFLLKFHCIGSIVLRAIEMYSIDFKSLSSEISYSFGKNSNKSRHIRILGRIWSSRLYIKVYLFQLILHAKKTVLVLPSELRKEYFKNFIFFERTIVFRNIPLREDYCLSHPNLSKIFDNNISSIIESNQFYLLGGNINSKTDLFYIAEHFKKYNKKILIAGNNGQLATECQRIFKDVVYYLGELDYKLLMFIISKSMGGIVLYNNSTVNQRLSASSKLFEYMYFCKPVIVSDNLGVINELRNENYPYSVISNDQLIDVVFYKKENLDCERFTLEFELSNNFNNELLL